jgi:chromosomal replication initiation ATPase DnaA
MAMAFETEWTAERAAFRTGSKEDESFVEQLVAAAFVVDRGALRSCSRGGRRAAFARQVGMYLAHTRLGFTLTAAGRLFGRDRTTAAHACKVVEERREDSEIDTVIDCLEKAVETSRIGAGGVAGR